MADTAEELITELLLGTLEQFDLPPDLQAGADVAYDDVGDWMSEHLDEGSWHVYSQGSMRLGTVVRPFSDEEYDVDAVAEWDVEKESITQDELKRVVGTALACYVTERAGGGNFSPTGLTESRRCWTVAFSGSLQMDILPAIPDRKSPPTGIQLPDHDLFRWQFSDPIAYSNWFFGRMVEQVIEEKRALAKRAQVEVDDIPDWQVKTTLQRVVQVLKLHRNHYFGESTAFRPPSIIVTTLAAHSYRSGSRLYDAVMEAVVSMPSFIERDGSKYLLPNPVQPRENFADIWGEDTAHAIMFFEWLNDLERTLEDSRATTAGLDQVVARLGSGFGEAPLRKSAQRLAESRTSARTAGRLAVTGAGALGAVGSVKVRDHTFHGA